MSMDWPECPGAMARRSPRIRAVLAIRATKRLCGVYDGSRLPAWVIADWGTIERVAADWAGRK